jgi:hypothetical protein
MRNEGTQEMNYGSIQKQIIICKGFYPRYSLASLLGGPQNRSGHCREEKHLAPAGNRTPAVQPVAHRGATDTGVIRRPIVSELHAPTVLPPVLISSFRNSG